jgi:peptidoglycan/xylan/chitin deacetylase (PgdA/CDA1 family)
LTGVALTFDDGPDPRWTPRLLDALRDAGAPATFFVLSGRAACQPQTIARMLDEGHEIGLHGHLHLRHDEHPREVIVTDTDEALALLAPQRPRLWRPPYGTETDTTRELAARHGLELVPWTVDSVDWQDGQSAELMLERIGGQLGDGAVVLMHDAIGPGATRSTPEPTVELVGPLIEAVRARGLEPVLLP